LIEPQPLRSQLRDLLQSGITHLQWALTRRELMHGIPTGVPRSQPDKDIAATKLRAALDLIATRQPRRLIRLQRDLRRILVTFVQVADAQYSAPTRTVLLDETYVCNPEVTSSHLATTIIHEATHARLFTAGIGYPTALRPRIERLCMRQELDFAERLPDGGAAAARARHGLNLPDKTWYPDVVLDRRLALIRSWGWPEWLVRIIERGGRRSAA
jgi:hypothetical protein